MDKIIDISRVIGELMSEDMLLMDGFILKQG